MATRLETFLRPNKGELRIHFTRAYKYTKEPPQGGKGRRSRYFAERAEPLKSFPTASVVGCKNEDDQTEVNCEAV